MMWQGFTGSNVIVRRGLLGNTRYYGFRLYNIALLAVLIAPILFVIALSLSAADSLAFPPPSLSLEHFAIILRNPEWSASLGSSLVIAILSAVLATTLGAMAAVGLSRVSMRPRRALATLAVGPLAIPATIWSLGLYFLYLEMGLIGTFTGLVIAHVVLTAPIVVVLVWINLRDIDLRLMQAAASLGAEPKAVFRTVALPLITPAICGAALIAFVTSFGDVLLALYLGGVELTTLPVAMFNRAQITIDTSIAAVGTVFVLVAGIVAAAVEYLRRWHARLHGED